MISLGDLLNIDLPIIQAPMAGVQGSALAIAVSNAGGLGSLPCAMLAPEGIRAELEAIRKGTTRPYNVNFFCHTAPESDPQREAAWLELLAPYYKELDVVPVAAAGPARLPFSSEAADVLAAYRPPVVSFHFGLPSPDLLARVRSWGARVLASATTVEEALWLESHGVDAIVAQGYEAGGHRGMFLTTDVTTQIGALALLPQIISVVTVPVIASGGIADAAGVAAALALGAAGVQIGTAYLLCPEATTSEVHRRALRSPQALHTTITNVITGRPARGIVNRFIREAGPLNPAAPEFPLAAAALAPLRAAAEARGSGDFSPLWAGQNVSGCAEIPAAELTRRLAAVPSGAGNAVTGALAGVASPHPVEASR
jgi:nitronate monooxygenase